MENTTNISSFGGISAAQRQHCIVYKFVLDTVFNWSLLVIGTIGNTLTCIVVRDYQSSSSMPLLMTNLAVTDTLVLVVWSNQLAIPALCAFVGGCPAYEHLQLPFYRYGWPLASTLHLMSTWSVVAITYTRFVSVCWPSRAGHLNNKKRVRTALFIMQISCLLFSAVRFGEGYLKVDESGQFVFVLNRMANSPVYQYFYLVVLFYAVSYFIPLGLLTYFTFRLATTLRQLNKKREQMSSRSREKNDMTFSLVIVVLVFISCQLASPLRRLIFIIYKDSWLGCGSPHFYYSSFSGLAVIFNSTCNFFIFCVFVAGFRRRLLRLCLFRGSVEPVVFSTTDNSQTNGQTASTRA